MVSIGERDIQQAKDDPRGEFEQACVRIVTRLRARQAEIDEAIFARISEQWLDRTGSDDPEYVAGLRAAGVAALGYVLLGIESQGECVAPVPVATAMQARRAARIGVKLDTVLRRYVAGYAVFEGFVVQEVERDESLALGGTLRAVLETMSALVDRLIVAVSRAYGEEIEQRADDPAAHRGYGITSAGAEHLRSTTSNGVAASSGRALGRRERIMHAMIELAADRGFENVSVKLVTKRAGVSTSKFYDEFNGLQDCFAAVLDMALEVTGGLIVEAFAREDGWQDGVLSALASLLVYFDSEPLLTRVWFVEALAAGSWALERRERIVAMLRSIIVEYWVSQGDEAPEPVAASGVMASVLGLIQTHLVTRRPEPLIELLGPLMTLVTSLHLDTKERAREGERGARLAREIQAGTSHWTPTQLKQSHVEDDIELPSKLANPSARRAKECLLYLAEHPDCSNSAIGSAIGVPHKSQISRLLSYLLEVGLTVKRSEGRAGVPNAWRLTPRGEEVARTLAERAG
jgi:AcrR family transcriptional regulator